MKKIAFILVLIITSNLFADIQINNSTVSNAIAKAEELKLEKKYSDAAIVYLEILNTTNKEAKLELTQEKNIKGYPLSADLQAQRLSCLFFTKEFGTEEFKNECLNALKKYKRKPSKDILTPYVQIYQQLLNYYWALNDVEKIENTAFEVTDYDPRAFPYVYHFLWKTLDKPVDPANDELAHPDYKETLSKIKHAINNYEKTNPPVNPQIQYFKLKLLEANGEDVFAAAAVLLKNNPRSDNLLAVLGIMRDAIDPDKPDKIKQYYKMLITLAIKQPSDQKHIKIVGALLSEKKKLETIMPELIEIH